jgi:CheY-like chemotaxis protein
MINESFRILLIEDNPTDIELFKFQLEKVLSDFQLIHTDNLKEFERSLKEFVPDIVFSDYNLPDCTGLDILRKTQEIDSEIPFYFLTGTINDEELAAETILAGADGYILKKHLPYLSEKLAPLFKRLLFNMEAKVELRERQRNQKIAINKIYDYLEELKSDNTNHKANINKIKEEIEKVNDNHSS